MKPEDKNNKNEDLQSIKEDQRTFSLLLDNLPGMAYRCGNDKDWTMKFMSRGCRLLTGYEPEELINNHELSYNDLIHPEDRSAVWGAVQKGIQNRNNFKMEYRIQTKKGDTKWVWEQGQGIFSTQKELLSLEGFITDITSKVLAVKKMNKVNQELELNNSELIESKRKFTTLIDNLPGIVYRCRNDKDWTMEYISDSCISLTGYKAEDFIINRKISYNDIIHPEDRDKVREWIQDAIQVKKAFEMRYRYRIITENGTTRWVWEKGRAVFNKKGEVIALEGFITDISDLVNKDQMLRQAQKMETIGTLASGLAHDFNNILGGVIASHSLISDLLKREILKEDEKIKLYLETANMASLRGADLVKQLLTLSRKGDPVYENLDINESIENVIKICRNSFPKEVVIKSTKIDGPVYIKADSNQIEQIILNICINASQAMTKMRSPGKAAGGLLSITVESLFADRSFCEIYMEAEEDLDYVAVTIRDTGVGIKAMDIHRIFEPFFTTKGKGGGTGLGLSMVYYIVKQHNGFLNIYSEPDIGTTFTLYFPRTVPEGKAESVSLREDESFRREGTVLVVDDEELMRVVIKGIFETIGFKVINTSSGREAVKRFEKQQELIDLVFLDLSMPEMSGEKVLKKILAARPDIKCVVTSGYRNKKHVKNLLNMGALYFVAKPFSYNDIIKMLKEIY